MLTFNQIRTLIHLVEKEIGYYEDNTYRAKLSTPKDWAYIKDGEDKIESLKVIKKELEG